MTKSGLFFDPQDHELIDLVNHFVEQRAQGRAIAHFDASLHPHGIIEMATRHSMRIAHAVITLLDSLKVGGMNDRLQALRRLHDEVLHTAHSPLRNNTGRVLIQVMKELVRSSPHAAADTPPPIAEDEWKERQLSLAHDFHRAVQGTPRIVRRLLRRYHLLEMPEEWNQQAFDHHVHDANTKGRKNPTHLVMDAWIKGIRFLTVVYYNRVDAEAAQELLHAARIMGITVRIGIEFRAAFRGRFVDLIWSPLGCDDPERFTGLLADPAISRIMDDYRPVAQWMREHTLALLEAWNTRHAPRLAEQLGISRPRPLDQDDFLAFVGQRQPSALHLAEYIHRHLLPLLQDRNTTLRQELTVDPARQRELRAPLDALEGLVPDVIADTWLSPAANPDIIFPHAPHPGMPQVLRDPPEVLLERLVPLHPCQMVLNLATLTAQDVLELIWRGKGRITHLELFNLREWTGGKLQHVEEINALQRALNEGSAPRLKHMIRQIVGREVCDAAEEQSASPACIPPTASETRSSRHQGDDARGGSSTPKDDGSADSTNGENDSAWEGGAATVPATRREERAADGDRRRIFHTILSNIPALQEFYARSPLGSRIGTDSTSRSHHTHGMGLAFVATLPPQARRILRNARAPEQHGEETCAQTRNGNGTFLPGERPGEDNRLALPITTDIYRFTQYHEPAHPGALTRLLRALPGLDNFGCQSVQGWGLEKSTTRVGGPGNLVTLGGVNAHGMCNDFEAHTRPTEPVSGFSRLDYLNTNLTNALKILAGFLPAQWAFFYTDSWWVLTWFGALLWFFITGFRNIAQSVVGGGGFNRSALLPWKRYISWSRLADSLLYTGLSVPLLEVAVRLWLLEDLLGLTVREHALIVYTVIAMVNSVYISAHNIFRGLPKEAVIGNLFRSALAVPLSMLFGEMLLYAFTAMHLADPAGLTQNCAAITAKCASDTVAAVIEGFADRNLYLRLREWDYVTKFSQIFHNFSRQELLFPHLDIEARFDRPAELLDMLRTESPDAARQAVANMLDMLYFWYYQPRARQVFLKALRTMSAEERAVVLGMQNLLLLEQEVSEIFLQGLLGRNFPHALSFYLRKNRDYLRELHHATER
mgnify:CR=1 FL=1